MTQTRLTGSETSKFVIRMSVENKTKPLITATRQFIRNPKTFNYASFQLYAPILVILPFLRGVP